MKGLGDENMKKHENIKKEMMNRWNLTVIKVI